MKKVREKIFGLQNVNQAIASFTVWANFLTADHVFDIYDATSPL